GVNKPNPFATGCHRLPFGSHGKEGVDGSSPSEGSAKPPHDGLFVSDRFADSRTWGRYGALYGAFRSKTPSSQAAWPTEKRVHAIPKGRREAGVNRGSASKDCADSRCVGDPVGRDRSRQRRTRHRLHSGDEHVQRAADELLLGRVRGVEGRQQGAELADEQG